MCRGSSGRHSVEPSGYCALLEIREIYYFSTFFLLPLQCGLIGVIWGKSKQKSLRRESLDQNVAAASCCDVSAEAVAHKL